MLSALWRSLFGKTSDSSRTMESPPPKDPRFPLGDGYYWEWKDVYNGYGGYRHADVCLLNVNDPTFRRCIVDGNGNIQSFPGFEKGPWVKDLQFPLDRMVRFVFTIYGYKDGKALVSWTIQPDGRYFEDEDGFGAEHFDEICLYSYLDKEGKFTKPFSIKR